MNRLRARTTFRSTALPSRAAWLGRAVLRNGLTTASIALGLIVLGNAATTATATERDTYRVKSAFREAVNRAAASTVRVTSDGRRAALGVVVDAQGYILTKASELKGDIKCHLADGRELPAKTVALRDDFDLAVLKITADKLVPIQWRETEPPAVGSWLATPGVGTIPVAIGVVSVAPRKIERQVPAMGILLDETDAGPRILRVIPNGGAARAGMAVGDVVTHLDDKPTESREALIRTVRERQVGEKVKLRVLRGARELTFEVVLAEMAQLMMASDGDQAQANMGGRLSDRRSGFPTALQHDTVLEPTQCGGPLVDLEGRAVGINIARASRVSSFAIPAAAIQPILAELKAGKLVSETPAQ